MRFATAVFLLLIPALVSAAPKIVVDQAVYDFGEIKEGTIVTHAFVIRNEGTDPLVFTRRPYSSCGCTVAALPKEVLLPGESLELVATFDSTGFGGHHVRKQIRVYTNDPENPVVILALVGYVRPAEPHERSAWNLQYSLYLLVDVRSPRETAKGTLKGKGAMAIPLDKLEANAKELPKDRRIVTYCSNGIRSEMAYELLKSKGYTKVGYLNETIGFNPDGSFTIE